MLDQAVQAGEALRQAAQQSRAVLIPAQSGCPTCNTAQVIAAPVLGACQLCGAEEVVLTMDERGAGKTARVWRSAA